MSEKNNDFLEEQRRAVERMNEMYRQQQIKSTRHPRPATPDFVKLNTENFTSTATDGAEPQKDNMKFPAPESNGDCGNKSDKNFNKTSRQRGFFDGILGGFNLPFKSGGKLDGDITLILGLLLILASEKADRKLLLALLYIIM